MISSLVLNSKNDIAFFYGEPLGFEPKWASIDMELGELYIVGNEDNDEMRPHKLDKIDEFVYLRLHERRKVLLVQVEKNDIRKPVATHEVPLMVPGQPWEQEKYDDRMNPKLPPHLQGRKKKIK